MQLCVVIASIGPERTGRRFVLIGIDHVVVVVRDLALAARDYRALGLTVTDGGRHSDGQTENALVGFEDGTYLELVGFVRPASDAHRWWSVFEEDGEGIVDYCLASDDLDADAARLSATGLRPLDPVSGGRQRPDGKRLEWRTLRFAGGGPGPLPFLIQDLTDRHDRVPGGDKARHQVGVTGITSLELTVVDPAASAATFRQLLGTEPLRRGDGELIAGVGPNELRIRRGDSPRDRISEIGLACAHGRPAGAANSPFGESGCLDAAKTHGARLRLLGPTMGFVP
jgi:catechol 2,3-dioxygenase-like lactoylglutathione lyase family enzyme